MVPTGNTADRHPEPVIPALRAGIAVYNSGAYHTAHDAWEDCWLDTEGGDERLLHGLIQTTAAVHHATQENWAGATGLAESARGYLGDLPTDYRDVNVGEIRDFLARFGADPRVERTPPIEMTHRGEVLRVADLRFDASAVVAGAVAESGEYDTELIERAVGYARADLDSGRETSPFVTLVLDFAREESRGIVYQRLAEHTQRRRARDESVDGLFEKR